jgi:hypothetical protein
MKIKQKPWANNKITPERQPLWGTRLK